MATHLPNKSLDANQQTNRIAQRLKCRFGHLEMPEPKSLIKIIWYNDLLAQVIYYDA